jgi:hypothetical protein
VDDFSDSARDGDAVNENENQGHDSDEPRPNIVYDLVKSFLCLHPYSLLSVPAVMACGWRRGGLPVFVGISLSSYFYAA